MSLLSSYAVVTSDKHGTILSANANAVKMFGWSAAELVGKKVNILMPAPYSDQHDSYMQRYHASKEPHVLGKSRSKCHSSYSLLKTCERENVFFFSSKISSQEFNDKKIGLMINNV